MERSIADRRFIIDTTPIPRRSEAAQRATEFLESIMATDLGLTLNDGTKAGMRVSSLWAVIYGTASQGQRDGVKKFVGAVVDRGTTSPRVLFAYRDRDLLTADVLSLLESKPVTPGPWTTRKGDSSGVGVGDVVRHLEDGKIVRCLVLGFLEHTSDGVPRMQVRRADGRTGLIPTSGLPERIY